ncbi:MAG: B12-binding domain-containing radical SAM protein [Thermoleophilia bacterium]
MNETKTKKVVLFFPNPVRGNDKAPAAASPGFPMSILALAGPLRVAGYEPVLIYEGIEDDLDARFTEACQGAICLGISSMTGNQLRGAIEYARFVRRRFPGMPIIWGGYHPSIMPEQTLAEDYVDAVVRGQGELAFVEVVRRLEGGRDLSGVAGVSYKDASGRMLSNPARPPVDLAELPPLPYELLDIERIIIRNSPGFRSLQYLSSTGCPFNCGFCAEPLVNKRKWLGRSADQVVRDVVALVADYRLDHLTFIDPNFFVSLKRSREILRGMLDAGVRIQWSAVARVDQVLKFDDELWKLIRDSGCRSLGVGAESGSPEILSMIDKRITVEEIYECSRKMRDNGVGGIFSFMVGFPLERDSRREEMMRTVAVAKTVKSIFAEIKTPICYYAPYPGSPLFPYALKMGFSAPATLEGWSDFGFTSVTTPWVSEQEKDFIERCSTFYFPIAYPDERVQKNLGSGMMRLPFSVMQRLARVRVKRDVYNLPVEWHLAKLVARAMGSRDPFLISQFYS